MTLRLVRTVAVLFLGAQAVGAQQAPPTFRSGVQAVELDVSVTDDAGRPVADLTKADFEILEDGKPQAVTSFSLVNIPIEPPRPYSATAADPDVATNTTGEGRLYVIVLDELVPVAQTAGGDAASSALHLKARQFLHTFIEQHFASNDVGLVVNVGRARSGDMQDFTSNRRLLLKAIDTYGGSFSDSMSTLLGSDGLNTDVPSRPAGAGAVGVQTGRQMRDLLDPTEVVAGSVADAQRAQARALRALMEALESIKGRRKAVMYVTNQVDNIWNVIDYNGGARPIEFDELHAAMTAAMRGGVAFYVFDPTGLDSLGTGSSLGDLERMDNLRKLSEATGGFAVVNSNGFDQALARVVAENSTYYVLGFTSTNDRRDGRYRQVAVRVRRPGLTVHTRDGYIAPSKNDPAPKDLFEGTTLASGVRESIRTPVANRSVPMSVFATALRGSGRDANVVIAVEMDAMRLGLSTSPTLTTGQIEIATAAISAAGKVERGQRERFTLNLEPDGWAQARMGGVRLLTGLALPPGRYQLRVAGGNVAKAEAGSVMYDLTVPDFAKATLTMSAPSLSSRHVGDGFTVALNSVRAELPHIPVTTREFAAGDTLSVYTEFYDGQRRDAHQLAIEAHLRTLDGTQVGAAVSDVRKSGPAVHKFEALLPIAVPPGAYTLHVEARSTLVRQQPVSRDIPLRVR